MAENKKTIEKEFTCIVCPMGCKITSKQDEQGNIISINGNTCPRGSAYVKAELTHPVRMLTTTMATADGELIPVRTSKPIPKELLFKAMEIINKTTAPSEVFVGQVLIEDILSSDSDIIASTNKTK